VLSGVDGIVAVTEKSANVFATTFGGPIRRIPRGVDLGTFADVESRSGFRDRVGTAASRDVLLYVGALSVEKRPDRFVSIVRRLADRGLDVEGWMVGDGPERPTLEQQARSLGDRLRMFGRRPHGEVASFMAAADLLLLTSDTEGTPGVVLEAAAVGLPAVASRVGGVEECVIDGETGVLVAADDEERFVEEAHGLFADDARRARLGERGRERVAAEFALSAIADRYLAFYRQVRS
jgi:glycosyltransferase involved in cell wall biosynthesis